MPDLTLTPVTLGALSLAAVTPGSGSLNGPSEVGDIPVWDGSGYDFLNYWFDIRSYGALVDGATDDTVAAQAACTACRLAGGGIVIISGGTCLVTADLIVGSNTTVWVAAGATLKRQSTTATCAVIKNFDQVGSTDTDITITGGGTIWRAGEATTANTPYDNAIQFINVTRAAVRNCRVRGGAKCVLMQGCLYPEVSGNWFDTFVDNGCGVLWTGSAFTAYGRVVNNHFATPTASGFSLGSSGLIVTASAVDVIGNVFVDQASNAIETGNVAGHLLIANNLMKYTGSGSVNNSMLLTDPDDTLIVGNLIEKGKITVAVTTPGSDINNRVSVIGNKLLTGGGIDVRNISRGSVSGNTVQASTLKGISVTSCNDVLVDGNVVSSAAKSGLYIATYAGGPASARIRVTNNLVFNNGTDSTVGDTYGFFVDAGDEVELVGNRAYDTAGGSGTQTHGLYINATTDYVDYRNDFVGNKTADRATFTSSPTTRWIKGDEITYTGKTSAVGVTATTEATAQTVIAGASAYYDGGDVWVEFFSSRIDFAVQTLALVLHDGTNALGQVNFGSSTAANGGLMGLYAKVRVTPAAGAKTLSWLGFITTGSGTITVRMGAGGAATLLPGYIRVTKA